MVPIQTELYRRDLALFNQTAREHALRNAFGNSVGVDSSVSGSFRLPVVNTSSDDGKEIAQYENEKFSNEDQKQSKSEGHIVCGDSDGDDSDDNSDDSDDDSDDSDDDSDDSNDDNTRVIDRGEKDSIGQKRPLSP